MWESLKCTQINIIIIFFFFGFISVKKITFVISNCRVFSGLNDAKHVHLSIEVFISLTKSGSILPDSQYTQQKAMT